MLQSGVTDCIMRVHDIKMPQWAEKSYHFYRPRYSKDNVNYKFQYTKILNSSALQQGDGQTALQQDSHFA